MLRGLKGKSIVVTGAGRGIGAEAARRLVAEGARVVVADVDSAAARAVAAHIGGGAVPSVADVSAAAGAAACVAAAVDAFGRLDGFFSNAGVEGHPQTVVNFDLENYERVFAVNVRGSFLCAQAALRQFAAQGEGGGSLLFTASLGALQGSASMAVYNASKHAIHGLVRSLSREVPAGVRVNALAPGAVDTRMMRSLEQSMATLSETAPSEIRKHVEQSGTLRRYATAEEVAATAAWVLSDEVPYLHGEMVTISGGRTP